MGKLRAVDISPSPAPVTMAPPRPARPAAVVVVAGLAVMTLYLLGWYWPQLAWVGRPLVWLATLFHELGHGAAALLLGGEVEQLAVYASGSGVVAHRGSYGALGRAAIAAAGPLGAPFAGLILFLSLGHRHAARLLLGAIAVSLVLVLLLWVRNPFGLVFVAVTAAILLLVALRAGERLLYGTSAFVAVVMSLSAFSNMDYLFMTGTRAMPSDTVQIAMELGLSYRFWGVLIAVFSLAIVALGLYIALRVSRASARQ